MGEVFFPDPCWQHLLDLNLIRDLKHMIQEGRGTYPSASGSKYAASCSWYVLTGHSHSRVMEKSGSLLCDPVLDELIQSRTLDWSIHPGPAPECKWIARTPRLQRKGDPFLNTLQKETSKIFPLNLRRKGAGRCDLITRLNHYHHSKVEVRIDQWPNKVKTGRNGGWQYADHSPSKQTESDHHQRGCTAQLMLYPSLRLTRELKPRRNRKIFKAKDKKEVNPQGTLPADTPYKVIK